MKTNHDAGFYWYKFSDIWTIIYIAPDGTWQQIGSSFRYTMKQLSGTLGRKIERRGR
jgi:hypothetical protein